MFTAGDFKVYFKHYRYFKNNRCAGASTKCSIVPTDVNLADNNYSIPDNRIGDAFCSVQDQFDKNTGRKIALARAIKSFSKEERAKFWDAYFKTVKGGKH